MEETPHKYGNVFHFLVEGRGNGKDLKGLYRAPMHWAVEIFETCAINVHYANAFTTLEFTNLSWPFYVHVSISLEIRVRYDGFFRLYEHSTSDTTSDIKVIGPRKEVLN